VSSLAILHASQLVTVAGPHRPRIGAEMQALAIIRNGGMLIRDGKIEVVGGSKMA
jgi:imidazolonepropionase